MDATVRELTDGLIEELVESAIMAGMNHTDPEAFDHALELVQAAQGALQWATR